jgi:hypothetical protein
MQGAGPPDQERRISGRWAPRYSSDAIAELRITRVHFRDQLLLCLLSDGNMICVPLSISRRLADAPPDMRYKWVIVEDGRAIVWHAGTVGVLAERLTVEEIVTHPEAQITELPEP